VNKTRGRNSVAYKKLRCQTFSYYVCFSSCPPKGTR